MLLRDLRTRRGNPAVTCAGVAIVGANNMINLLHTSMRDCVKNGVLLLLCKVNVVCYDHIMLTTPVPISTRKLSSIERD